MKRSDKQMSFAEKAKAVLDGMTDEEFLAAVEERCPELIHGQGPKPHDAMVPGPVVMSGPSLTDVWNEERAKVVAEKKRKARAVAAVPPTHTERLNRPGKKKSSHGS